MADRLVIVIPRPGRRIEAGDVFNVDILVDPDTSWNIQTLTTTDISARLYHGANVTPNGVVTSPVANRFRIPFDPATAPGGAWQVDNLATILVFLTSHSRIFSRMSIRIVAAASADVESVTINSPDPGTNVSYPFTASGTATAGGGTPNISGLIIPGIGGAFAGTTIVNGAAWSVTFNTGPTSRATLKVTNSVNNLSAQESINVGGG